MNPSRFLKWLRNLAGFEFPFFLFASLILLGIGIGTILGSPALREPLRMIPFAILMVIHVGLYWVVLIVAKSARQTLTYLAVQSILAFALNLLGQTMILIYGLYMALVGITIGLLKVTRWSMLFIALYLGLSLVNYGAAASWSDALSWATVVIPTTIFIVMFVLLYLRQAEAKEQAEKLAGELETANRRLAEYADKVEDLTLAAERQRMARELHDTLSQGLAGLILQLQAAEAHLSSQRSERAASILHEAIAQARSTLGDARRAIDDLRQGQAEAPDLAEAVSREAGRFSAATGIPCELEVDLPRPLAAALGEAAQRSLAEGLTNVARHARASRCRVRVKDAGEWLELVVADDGTGFNPAAAADQVGHYGLLGLSERARLSGGTFDLTSTPGVGTTLTLRLPIQGELTANPGASAQGRCDADQMNKRE